MTTLETTGLPRSLVAVEVALVEPARDPRAVDEVELVAPVGVDEPVVPLHGVDSWLDMVEEDLVLPPLLTESDPADELGGSDRLACQENVNM